MSRLAIFFWLVITPGFALMLLLLGLETRDANLLGWFLLCLGIVYGAGVVIVYGVRKESFLGLVRRKPSMTEDMQDRSY